MKINPTDSRGYRTIVGLTNSQMSSTLNRKYTSMERLAVHSVTSLMEVIYERIGLIAQSEVAGNNCQDICPSSGDVIVGYSEPSCLHAHLIGRGQLGREYISGNPLTGPRVGEMFNMRGDDKAPLGIPGNMCKEQWMDMKSAREVFRSEIIKLMNSEPIYSQCGLSMTE